jgi:peptidyl-prolyl cis-trans isomerase SurA
MKRLVACLIVAFCSVAVRAEPEIVNGIVAIVNDKVITVKDLILKTQKDVDFLERRYGAGSAEFTKRASELRAEATEELIDHNLVLHEFNTLGHPLPESYIENRIADHVKQFGDRLTLTKTLQAEGYTWEGYREQIKEQTILELMWHNKVPPDPVISPTKIENYYVDNREKFQVEDQIKLRVIVLTNAGSIGLAREIAKKLDDGAPFAEMAKVYSQSPSAPQGGDMGKVDRKTLREELAKVAFALPPGKRSDPIEVGNSVFLLYVESAEPAHTRTLSEVRQEIEDTLKAQEIKRLRKQFVDRLRKKSFVRYF